MNKIFRLKIVWVLIFSLCGWMGHIFATSVLNSSSELDDEIVAFQKAIECKNSGNIDSCRFYLGITKKWFKANGCYEKWLNLEIFESELFFQNGYPDSFYRNIKATVDKAEKLFDSADPLLLRLKYSFAKYLFYGFEDFEQAKNQTSEILAKIGGNSDLPDTLKGLIYLLHGEILTAQWESKKAIKALKSAITLFNNSNHLNIEHLAATHGVLGLAFLDNGNYEFSKESMEKSIELAEAIFEKRPDLLADNYSNMGNWGSDTGELMLGLKNHKKSLEIRQHLENTPKIKLAESNNNLGVIYWRLGDLELGGQYLLKSLDIMRSCCPTKSIEIAAIQNNLSIIYREIGDLETALHHAKSSYSLLKKKFNEEHFNLASSLENMGLIYNRMGDFEKSLECNYRALIIRKKYNYYMASIETSYQNLSHDYYNMGDLKTACSFNNEAIRLLENDEKSSKLLLARTYSAKGILQSELGNHSDAILFYEKANAVLRTMEGFRNYDFSNNYTNLGLQYSISGNFQRAIDCHLKSIYLKSGAADNIHPSIAQNLNQYGVSLIRAGRYLDALEVLQKSFKCNFSESLNLSQFEVPKPESFAIGFDLLKTYQFYATAAESYFLEVKPDLEVLKSGLNSSLMACQLLDSIKMKFSPDSKKRVFRVAKLINERGLEICNDLLRNGITQDIMNYSFIFSERNKSGLLMEAITNSRQKGVLKIPDSLKRKEKEFSSFLSYNQRKVIEEEQKAKPDSEILLDYKARYLKNKFSLDSIISEYETKYPQYYKLKFDYSIVSIPEVQSWIKCDSTILLEYFYGIRNIYCFAIAKDTVHVHSFPNDSTFKSQVETLQSQFAHGTEVRDHLANSPEAFREFTEASHALYNSLIWPSLTGLGKTPNQLIIVPDGPLGKLPFDILLTEPVESREVAYHKCHYLLQDCPITYAWSATVLLEQSFRTKQKEEPIPFLAIAPPYEFWPEDSSLKRQPKDALDSLDQMFATRTLREKGGAPSPLKYAAEEAKQLGIRFGATVLVDSTATEGKFVSLAPRAKIIHLGAHGFLNTDHPEYSNIALLPDKNDTTNLDGRLHISEIFNLDLNADLIVLPVCNSSTGKNQTGEGIMSTARAFRYAGCPNVVASQWEVDDETAMEISLDFYDNLALGMGKAEALRQAKLKRLREGGTAKSHPFYWAPLVLVGDNEPIEISRPDNKSRKIILLLLAAMIFTGIVFARKRVSKAA